MNSLWKLYLNRIITLEEYVGLTLKARRKVQS